MKMSFQIDMIIYIIAFLNSGTWYEWQRAYTYDEARQLAQELYWRHKIAPEIYEDVEMFSLGEWDMKTPESKKMWFERPQET